MSSFISQIPNFLTLSRIVSAPILVVLLENRNYKLALVLFVVAGITDGLDGWIAKRFNFTSQLGATLDPLADKIIIVSAYIMLVLLGKLPFWLVTLVIFRDLLIVGGVLMLTILDRDVPMKPTKTSKINTALQIILVIAVLIENSNLFSIVHVSNILIYTVAIMTIASGAQYIWVWAIRRSIKYHF